VKGPYTKATVSTYTDLKLISLHLQQQTESSNQTNIMDGTKV